MHFIVVGEIGAAAKHADFHVRTSHPALGIFMKEQKRSSLQHAILCEPQLLHQLRAFGRQCVERKWYSPL